MSAREVRFSQSFQLASDLFCRRAVSVLWASRAIDLILRRVFGIRIGSLVFLFQPLDQRFKFAYAKLLAYRIALLTASIIPARTCPRSSSTEELIVMPEATDIDSFSVSGFIFAASRPAALRMF